MNCFNFGNLNEIAKLGFTLEACYNHCFSALIYHEFYVDVDGNADVNKRAKCKVQLSLDTSDLCNIVLTLKVKATPKALQKQTFTYLQNKVKTILDDPFYYRSKNRPVVGYRKWLNNFDEIYNQEPRQNTFTVESDTIKIRCSIVFNISLFVKALRTFEAKTYQSCDKYEQRVITLLKNYDQYPYSPNLHLAKLLSDQSKHLSWNYVSDVRISNKGFVCDFNYYKDGYRLRILGKTEELNTLSLARSGSVYGRKNGNGSLTVNMNVGKDHDPFEIFAKLINTIDL